MPIRPWFACLVLCTSSAFAQWPPLQPPAAHQGGGEKDTALIISIGDYVFLPDVAGAKENATAWYQYLTVTRGVLSKQVIWVQDNEATLEGVRDALATALAKTKPGGTLWLLFIGHGAPSERGDDGVLVGADAQNIIRSIYPRSLSRKELLKLVDGGKQARAVVLLDACFSGQSAGGVQLADGSMPTLPERELSLTSAKPVLLLTAGTSRQFAGALPGMQVPAFSYLALGALRGWADENRDGAVTAGEVVSFMNEVMSTTVRGRVQTPQLNPESASGVVLTRTTTRAELPLNEVVLWLREKADGNSAPATATGPRITSGMVAPVIGALSIATKPNGATVELTDPQGRKSTTTTPLLDPKALVGRWKVKAIKEGFGVEEAELDVRPDDTAMVSLTLKAHVGLEVTGSPTGALVKVNGPGFQNEGGLPWRAEGLTAGTYRVTVMREGYTPFESSRALAPGAFERIAVTLVRADVTQTEAAPEGEGQLTASSSLVQKPRRLSARPLPTASELAQAEADEAKANGQIESLKKIIPKIEDGNPQKAELLFQLSELYWEQSKRLERKELAAASDKTADHRESGLYQSEVIRLHETILREYPAYERSDEVLFNQAYILYATGRTERALTGYADLIKKYPASKFISDAYIQVGNHFFDVTGDVAKARKAYEQAFASSNPRIKGYALYKLGWCDLNSGEWERALKKFKDVVALCESNEGKSFSELRHETLRDLSTVFVKVGRPEEARAYFEAHKR